jgi:hypothetical protein
MTKHDKVFLSLVLISVAFVGAVITQNLATQAHTSMTEKLAAVDTSSAPYDPAQAEAVRKKFESIGLQPHEGRFWQP